MTKKTVLISMGSAVLLLVLTLALLVNAQTVGDRQAPESVTAVQTGIADPPPAGFTVLYNFTGARDTQNAATNSAATSIHCSNAGQSSTQVIVELTDFDANPTISATVTIASNKTATVSSQATVLYSEDAILTSPDDLNQGSGRVLVSAGADGIICTAQVLDPVGNPPNYIINLDLFRP